MQMAMVRIVTWLMIGAGLALLPAYGLWVLGGRFMDRLEQRRYQRRGLGTATT